MTPQQVLAPLRASLAQWQQGSLGSHALVAAWRLQADVLSQLPPKYKTVFDNLLLRVESSALFTEESCSFSAQDLAASLSMWLDKAQTQLHSTSAHE
jgi:hypothetical protein